MRSRAALNAAVLARRVISLALWVIYGQTPRLHLLDLFTSLERIMYSCEWPTSAVQSFYRTERRKTAYRTKTLVSCRKLCFNPCLYVFFFNRIFNFFFCNYYFLLLKNNIEHIVFLSFYCSMWNRFCNNKVLSAYTFSHVLIFVDVAT